MALLWLAPALAAGPAPALKTESLSVGFTPTAFLNMNRNDVEAAFKVLAETIGRKRGYLVRSRMQLFETPEAAAAAMRRGEVNLIILDSWTYLAIDVKTLATPAYVSSAHASVGRQYVLVTHTNSGLNTLAGLRGKSLNLFEASNASVGRHWLDTLLLADSLGTQEAFFGRIENCAKPADAVLPVFFGKRDVCLVDQQGFETMTELNPQVGKALHAVTVSKPLLNAVICLNRSGWPSETFRKDLQEVLGELHLEPAGWQVLTLFKSEKLIPFDETQLDTVKKLRAAHDQLRQQSLPKAGAASPLSKL